MRRTSGKIYYNLPNVLFVVFHFLFTLIIICCRYKSVTAKLITLKLLAFKFVMYQFFIW